jgi:tRNA threonylcarbamoyladenosine biosynthesis protein TsaB
MIVLGIDTALSALSAAVVKAGVPLAREWRELARGHAEALAPMVERVMGAAELGFAELELVAVTTGPGTFAGQRVGIAFARALALAIQKPAIGVTTLDAMEEAALGESDAPWAAALADAKRDEVYCGARSRSGEVLIAPELISAGLAPARLVALASRFGPSPALAGTAAVPLMAALEAAGLTPVLSAVRQPDALFVARLAAAAPIGPAPKPLYLRPPDARLPGAL